MIELDDVRAAQPHVAEVARHTPTTRSYAFSDMTGADVHLKLETYQRTGSFKIRGAANRIARLSPTDRDAGVVTASAGNHAQGVALAATRAGVGATIVMPKHAPISKVNATKQYGATVELHGEDYSEAQARAKEIEREEGRTYVHAFDDWTVIAGQGTVGLELYDDLPAVDTVVVPVGGGGLIAGIATALSGLDPEVRVIGVQASGAASAARSFEAGEIQTLASVDTIADGLATRRVGEKPFQAIQEHVDDVVTVSDSEIAVALVYALERSKTLLEGAAAVSLAAILERAFEYREEEVIVPILSGGNIDMNTLTTVIMRGLAETGRYLKIRTVLQDVPGALVHLASVIAEAEANIYAVYHD
ncbi:MAG: threonine ammonia-lyase, partial [Halobacteriales archaeon]|nr:threonine ammonia-lyase [Halobacteriales archaeon]